MTRREHVRVLVVDDSAVVRQLTKSILEAQPDIEVRTAADPLIAKSKLRDFTPDVILLDLEMPRMDGLTFLRWLMAEQPIPVVICSSLAKRGTRPVIEALAHGAVEIVLKPRVGVREFLEESAIMLTDVVRAAAQVKPRSRRALIRAPRPAATSSATSRPRSVRGAAVRPGEPIVAVGSSTGGPQALGEVLSRLPENAPSILVVQHMPAHYTAAFARHLDERCAVSVSEADSGDRVERGRALIAPGGRHMMLRRCDRGYQVEIVDGPLVSRHRPSVDVLFRSVAREAGRGSLGIILTGMGNDGVQGLLEMRSAGMRTAAQDRSSSVIYGMPREAIECGAAQEVVELSAVAALIGSFSIERVAASRGGRHRR